jgi:predicted glutamine amidotransferase
MCKVLLIAGIKPEHVPKVHKLAKAAAKSMSLVEDDGVGYAAITKNGKIYGEKWRNKDDAFQLHSQPKVDPLVESMSKMLGNMADWGVTGTSITKVYDSFGDRSQKSIDETVGLILHARKATGGTAKTIENVHPFSVINSEEHPDTALIHNGSIMNHEKLKKTMSTCDSEVILHEYLANQMYYNPWGIEQVAKTLIGEYAVGVLSSMLDSDGMVTPILDVFKSGKDLMVAYIPEIETFVFCTMEHTLQVACQEVGFTVKNPVKLKEGHLLRLNAVTGERIDEVISFTTSAKWYNDYSHAHTYSRARQIGPYAHSEHNDFINPITGEYTEDDGITETVDVTLNSQKKHFERRHPALFTMRYLEVENKLEQNEKALFAELSKGRDTNHKALHLVAVALAAEETKV